MTEDRRNLLERREILLAYVTVLEQTDRLFEICASTAGDIDDLRSAVADAFGLSTIAAEAVVHLQVRRFTPRVREQLREELADLDRRLGLTADV